MEQIDTRLDRLESKRNEQKRLVRAPDDSEQNLEADIGWVRLWDKLCTRQRDCCKRLRATARGYKPVKDLGASYMGIGASRADCDKSTPDCYG
ncbi:hypothetical protein ACVIHI_008536 [Bradyrhizobium sp. USDA 4524]|uniref:hypothetical protein n=1 Tax=unclassified Bradyrhizobium TaxID=2631580 RepID=UPI00209D345D|nr:MULTISPECIES: hypothetical protein [unclassified Bradyrhizobium]MCP1846003.1 hypothetical protein [Bradyrhizobium sp. USDA 4538]MCP1907363.1 hypothetical protein [Bradyrhizobium sp. USDA 4537]MCP1985149.1 hypothetical protein [Bradyrhizobium sp. USDA 4539]